jgi:hypothetical protein
MPFKEIYSAGEFLDFRMIFKISAFLFKGLIFFVTFLHQGKKVKALYSERKFMPKLLNSFLSKALSNGSISLFEGRLLKI